MEHAVADLTIRDTRPAPQQPDVSAWAAATQLVPWRVAPRTMWQPGHRFGRWFGGGLLNAAEICVDRHAERTPHHPAIRWEGEPGDRRCLSYAQLQEQVVAAARALRGLGVSHGDVVALHVGWLPETVALLFGCARIGAVASVLPTPLPPEALADRLTALSPKVLVTQDGAWRRGTVLPLKARADDALTAVGGIEHTVVVRRTGIDVAWFEGDRWYHDLVAGGRPGQARDEDAPAPVPAAHPLLLVSLANRRGRSITLTQGTGPLVVSAAAVHRWGLAAGDVLWCAGDISWLGTLAHGVYGPLASGTTSVMYEGTLDVPTRERAWQIMRRHGVTTVLTTPSVLRTMQSWSVDRDHAVSAGRVERVVAFGEPMTPALRDWIADGLEGRDVAVADGWGQMELGGIVRVDAPVDRLRMPDTGSVLVDRCGRQVAEGTGGELVLTRPWAGAMTSATGAVEVLDEIHWSRFPGVYATGDRARQLPDGSLDWLGRSDEVVSVSGQLVSLTEVRDLLLEHPWVACADVVERGDHSGGRLLTAAVVLAPEARGSDLVRLSRDLKNLVRESLGGLAKPRLLLVVDRFGDELSGGERRRALCVVPVGDSAEPTRLRWEHLLRVAGYAE